MEWPPKLVRLKYVRISSTGVKMVVTLFSDSRLFIDLITKGNELNDN